MEHVDAGEQALERGDARVGVGVELVEDGQRGVDVGGLAVGVVWVGGCRVAAVVDRHAAVVVPQGFEPAAAAVIARRSC